MRGSTHHLHRLLLNLGLGGSKGRARHNGGADHGRAGEGPGHRADEAGGVHGGAVVNGISGVQAEGQLSSAQ